jgi:glutamate carboxypeptidase
VIDAAERVAVVAERELEALVGVSTPSGDVAGAEEAVALCIAFLPPEAEPERVPCSTEGHAPDLICRLRGSGTKRLVLVGHLDTVVSHEAHRAVSRDGDKLIGSGAVDMKGGVALALGVMRELATRPELYDEAAVLLVNDEEWRTVPFTHTERFAGWDACLCFEAGEVDANGDDALIARRKAAGTLEVHARGLAAHSGSAPHKGRSALLALATVAQGIAAQSDPGGPDRLTAVPTILRAGEAFNVVPPQGRLVCDLRADDLDAFQPVLASVPGELDGVAIESELVRAWPGMDTRPATARLIEEAAGGLGRPLVASERGGASDASHMAAAIALTIDGLGPRGGGAHTPAEWVSAESLRTRAEVALAVVEAVLEV